MIFQLERFLQNHIQEYIQQNKDLLDVIRIWDWDAAFAKLKPEIGLIPYVDFEDNDILRFNGFLILDSVYETNSASICKY